MLQFITHQTDRLGIVEGAIAALNGGCKWIQLRMKESPIEEVKRVAEQLIPLCKKHEAILVLDDYAQLAADLDTDGVHLGKLDMPVSEARQLIGEKYIIGGTANTFEEIQELARQDADYIGLGPFRFTETKKNLSPILGIEGYARIVEQCARQQLEIPIVAIGGITAEDIPAIMETGVSGIALSGTILQAEDPEEETRKILDILNKYSKA